MSMQLKKLIILYTQEDIPQVVTQLLGYIDYASIVTLIGSLGAGKTTLIKALLQKMGVQETIASPTFTYVNHYLINKDKQIYHFDLYRLPDLQAFCRAGLDEYLHNANALSIIEWPEIIKPLLKQYTVCTIELEYVQEDLNTRKLTLLLEEKHT